MLQFENIVNPNPTSWQDTMGVATSLKKYVYTDWNNYQWRISDIWNLSPILYHIKLQLLPV